ncbi:MAG: OmpA family protein [Bacteroidota bacterium]
MRSLHCSALVFFFLLCFPPPGIKAQEIKPTDNEAVFNVAATSKSGKPRQGEIISLVSQKSKKSYQGITNPEGKCTILIPSGDKYDIYYKYFSQQVRYHDIDVPGGDHRMTYAFSMKYDPPKKFTLKNVFFDTGKAGLRKESNAALDELAEALKLKPSMVIEIAGHTDNAGTAEANQELSAGRAKAVRDYLLLRGIGAGRVIAKGYGETQPVADNSTEDGRQQNRRTEVRIINE